MFRAIEAVDANGRVRGMVGFDNWTKSACCLSIALDSPIAFRSLLAHAFAVPFDDMGRTVVFVSVVSTNSRSLKLVRHVGFREVATAKDAWDVGVDLVMFEMRREDCRWLKRKKEAA